MGSESGEESRVATALSESSVGVGKGIQWEPEGGASRKVRSSQRRKSVQEKFFSLREEGSSPGSGSYQWRTSTEKSPKGTVISRGGGVWGSGEG